MGRSRYFYFSYLYCTGKGLKKSFKTDRIIRQIDLAPTVAALVGVRMPAQCEGAPAYQIFEEELIYN